MRPIKKFSKNLKQRFAKKQNEMRREPGVMGDSVGGLLVSGLDGFVYVTIGDKAFPVFNNRVPAQIGIKVWVGYAPEEPNLYQVLSTRSESPAGVETGFVGYAPAKRYEWHAVGGGQDPLNVHLRAFTPLKLGVSSAGGMNVDLYRGFVWTGTEYLTIARQDLDLTTHIPTDPDKAALVLITIDDAGAVVQTKGSEVDIDLLALSDLPAIPAGTVFVCGAVRVYTGQTAVQEGRTNTDFWDGRFPGYFTAGGGGAHVITEEGGAGLTARTNLNFIGASVTATDNAGTDSTDITVTSGAGDVVGPASAVDENLAAFDTATGKLIKDSGVLTSDVSGAVSASHARSHAITGTSDHTSSATPGQMLKADASGLPIDATNTDTDVASAVSLKHAAVTLDANADTLLSLSTQALGLDTQTANTVLAGATSGGVAVPAFRALVAADIPATIPDENILHDKVGSPALFTLHDDWITRGSAGVIDGTLTYLSVGSTAVKVSVAAGDGYIRVSDDQQAELKFIHWAASADLYTFSAPAAGQETAIFFGISYNAGTPIAITSSTFSDFNGHDKFWLGRASYDGTSMEILNSYAHAEDTANLTRRWMRLNFPFNRE